MIHDIDLIQSLVRSPIVSIDAVGTSVFSSGLDIANARIRYANGCVANTTASRVSMKTERKLRLFQDDAYVSIDLQQKVLTIVRKPPEGSGAALGQVVIEERTLRAGRCAQARDRVFPRVDRRRPSGGRVGRGWAAGARDGAKDFRPGPGRGSAVMRREHYAGNDFRRAITIEDLRRIARRRLPAFSFEYVDGGSEDEVALRRNRDVFERITWLPRTLAGVGSPDLATTIFGRTCHLPVIIAPTGFNGLLWPQGDLALARAAASAGIPFTLSTVSNYSLAKMKGEVDRPLWFQLYPVKDRRRSTGSSISPRNRAAKRWW